MTHVHAPALLHACKKIDRLLCKLKEDVVSVFVPLFLKPVQIPPILLQLFPENLTKPFSFLLKAGKFDNTRCRMTNHKQNFYSSRFLATNKMGK